MKIFGKRPCIAIAAVALIGALAACDKLNPLEKPLVQPCPDYFILEDAANLTKFRDGPGRDLTDVTYRAEMKSITLECVSNIDKATKSGTMDIQIAPVVGAEMGAAYHGGDTTVPMFVVVTDPDKKILYREVLKMAISFDGNKTRLIAKTPPTVIEVPITPAVKSKYYKVYGGFELTQDEAKFNRDQIAKGLR